MNSSEYALPEVELGDTVSFEDENGDPVKATCEGFQDGVPMFSEPVPSEPIPDEDNPAVPV